MRLRSIFFLLFLSLIGRAQLLDTAVVENGKSFCFHKMEQGQTLFALSRYYKIGYSIIKANNPDKGDEIALGDLIRLPCALITDAEVDSAKARKSVTKKDTVVIPLGYRPYVVKAGETVYTLSRQNACAIDSFMLMNPHVRKEGLKEGMTVFFEDTSYMAPIAVSTSIQKDTTTKALQNKASIASRKETIEPALYSKEVDSNAYRIAVALPFLFDESQKKLQDLEVDMEPELHPQTKLFLEFYQGFSAGLDSLTTRGIKTQVFYYDTKGDSNVVKRLPQEFARKGIHAVVGPAIDEQFMILSERLKGSSIHMISPYGRDKAILINNPNAVKVLAAEESRVPVLAKYLHQHFKDSNLVFTYHTEIDKRLVETLQAELLSISLMEDSLIMAAPEIVKGIYEPLTKLIAGKLNIVVCLSRDESFVTKLAGKLHSRKEDHRINLIGVDEWKDYKNLEAIYWNDLHMAVAGNLDFRFVGITQEGFFKDYYSKYFTEPSYQAALAYDIATNLFSGISGVELDFKLLSKEKSRGCLSDYYFKPGTGNFGTENRVANVYEFSNYKFVKVSP